MTKTLIAATLLGNEAYFPLACKALKDKQTDLNLSLSDFRYPHRMDELGRFVSIIK